MAAKEQFIRDSWGERADCECAVEEFAELSPLPLIFSIILICSRLKAFFFPFMFLDEIFNIFLY